MEYDGWLRISTEIETKEFDAQIDYIENQMAEIEDKLKQADMGFDVGDVSKLEAQYEKLGNQLITLKQKQEDLNKADLKKLEKSIDNIGNSTSKTIKKVGKWALAVFSVRSAYMFVRQAVSKLSQYNEQLASDLEYIGFALATMLQPLIEGLVQLAYRLLSYVNYIAQAWFGVNLFASASADAMNKSAKSAKEMKKSLAGFDEMNVVSDNSSGSNSIASPSVDLSGMQGEVPIWLQWIADNKEIVLSTLAGIAGGILAVQLGFSALQGLGIGVILAGVILLIQGIVDFIKDPSWENFLTILQGIALIVAGIAILMGGWIVALIALGVAIVTYVIKNWDKVKEILGVVGTWIYDNIIKPIANFFVNLWNGIVNGITNAINKVKNVFYTVVNFFKNIISTIVNLFKNIGTKVGDVIGSAFKTVINGILSAIENILNFPIKSINKLLDIINKVPGINITKLSTFNLPRLKSGGIINQPGRGVPLGIGGEAGKEGVIPLTDSQAMEELGSAIGRYITINATLINQMNGRTISRELKTIQNERAFATNR